MKKLKNNFWSLVTGHCRFWRASPVAGSLLAILLLAAILRFYQLSSVPPSLNWDETALGYNAYSILKTGRDEYGKILPLVFKSFGDFKPGIYVYLTIPFVALFGLTEFAVRAPSALFGVLTIGFLYFLVKELFDNKRLALIAALFLAISPWHLILSRPAFEANVALSFNLLGILFFLKFVKSNSLLSFLILASSFLVSLYTYQGSKLIVPLLLSGLMIFWLQDLIRIPKKYLLLSTLFILLAIPIYFGSIFGGQGGRLEVFSVFSYPRTQSEIEELAAEGGTSPGAVGFQLFHNEPLYFTRTIISHHLNHFSPRFLFFEGDYQNKRTDIANNGMMYLFDIVFLLVGVYAILNFKGDKKKYFILFWLVVTPLPAALSRDLVAPIRALNLVIPLVILSAFGAWLILDKTRSLPKIILLALLIFGVGIIYNFLFLLDSYFIHNPKIASPDWLYGYKEAVEIVKRKQSEFDQVIFTTAYNEPYIFTLFYTQYPPQKYQPQARLEHVRGSVDVGEAPGFDNFVFRPIYYPVDRDLKNTLLIGTTFELPDHDLERDVNLGKIQVIEEINYLNGEIAFKIVEVR